MSEALFSRFPGRAFFQSLVACVFINHAHAQTVVNPSNYLIQDPDTGTQTLLSDILRETVDLADKGLSAANCNDVTQAANNTATWQSLINSPRYSGGFVKWVLPAGNCYLGAPGIVFTSGANTIVGKGIGSTLLTAHGDGYDVFTFATSDGSVDQNNQVRDFKIYRDTTSGTAGGAAFHLIQNSGFWMDHVYATQFFHAFVMEGGADQHIDNVDIFTLPPGVGPNNPITSVSWANGQATYTTTYPHGLLPNAGVTFTGFSPSGYNGNYVTQAGTTGNTIVIAMASNPGSVTTEGVTLDGAPSDVQVKPWVDSNGTAHTPSGIWITNDNFASRAGIGFDVEGIDTFNVSHSYIGGQQCGVRLKAAANSGIQTAQSEQLYLDGGGGNTDGYCIPFDNGKGPLQVNFDNGVIQSHGTGCDFFNEDAGTDQPGFLGLQGMNFPGGSGCSGHYGGAGQTTVAAGPGGAATAPGAGGSGGGGTGAEYGGMAAVVART